MEEPRHVLVGARSSPPLEAMRWLFERQGVAYEERTDAPGFGARGPTSPDVVLMLAPEGPVTGVRNCLRRFEDMCRPGQRPFGEDDDARAHAWALIETFCERMTGPASRLEDAETSDVCDAARASVEAAFAVAEGELADGRPFIGGEAPSGVDVVFAALAAPVILPDRVGTPGSTLADAPATLAALVEAFRATPGGALALRVFGTRPAPQPALAVPVWRPSLFSRLATPKLVRGAARLIARFGPRTVRVKGATLAFRWADVSDVLRRDADFLIAPVNAERIEAVSGRFILGMDRSPELFAQRGVVYSAFRAADRAPVVRTLLEEPERLLDAAVVNGRRIDVVNGYARPVAARVAAALFGIAGPSEADLTRVARAVFEETFLNLGGEPEVKRRGVAAGRELLGWIDAEAAGRRTSGDLGGDLLGRLLALERDGALEAHEIGPALAGLLVGSIDTTATAVANIVAEMMADAALGEAIARDAGDPERLWGWCLEALRRRPHNPILLRQAASGVSVAGRPVPAGERVIAVTLSAMQDARAFDAPALMSPTRPRALYMHFGHGMHLCSGRDLNAVQIPALVGALARRRPTGKPRVENRGPFPDKLIVELGSRT